MLARLLLRAIQFVLAPGRIYVGVILTRPDRIKETEEMS